MIRSNALIVPLCMVLSLGLASPIAAQSATKYGLGYQFGLKVGADQSSIQTTAQVRVGESVTHDLGRYRVTLRLESTSRSKLNLNVYVTDLDSDVVIEGGVLSGSTPVSLNSITEFDVSNELASLQIAVGVGEIAK